MSYQDICKSLKKEAGMKKEALLPKGKLTDVILKRLGQMTKLVNNPKFSTSAFNTGIKDKFLPIMSNDPAYKLGAVIGRKLNSPALELVGDPREFYKILSSLGRFKPTLNPATLQNHRWLKESPIGKALARLERAGWKRAGDDVVIPRLVADASRQRVLKSIDHASTRGIKGLEDLLG